MLLFVCVQCDCVDAVEMAFVGELPSDPSLQVCTFCKTDGKWHDRFEREIYDSELDEVCNRPTGFALG